MHITVNITGKLFKLSRKNILVNIVRKCKKDKSKNKTSPHSIVLSDGIN